MEPRDCSYYALAEAHLLFCFSINILFLTQLNIPA
jgi:hypothetical protein